MVDIQPRARREMDMRDPSSWQQGFSHGGGGLRCDICRCVVPQTPGDTSAHLDWHEELARLLQVRE